MEDLRINLQQACSVRLCYKYYSTSYIYKKSSGFWFWKKKEGFYEKNILCNDKYVAISTILKDKRLYIEGTKVYYKPHFEVKMSNGQFHEQYFKTDEELKNHVDYYFKSFKSIIQLS
jgi:hypothetical protein